MLIPLGGLLSATVVGIVIGGPLLLMALALLRNSVTRSRAPELIRGEGHSTVEFVIWGGPLPR